MSNNKDQFEKDLDNFFERKFEKIQKQKLEDNRKKSQAGFFTRKKTESLKQTVEAPKVTYSVKNITEQVLLNELSLLSEIISCKPPVVLTTKYQTFDHESYFSQLERRYGIKCEYNYPYTHRKIYITPEEKARVLSSTRLGKLYTEIGKSALGEVIKTQINETVSSTLKKAYDENKPSLEITYTARQNDIVFSHSGPRIIYLNYGFGKMSEDATQAISLIVCREVSKVLDNLDICEGYQSSFFKSPDYFDDNQVEVRVTFDCTIKKNKSFISW